MKISSFLFLSGVLFLLLSCDQNTEVPNENISTVKIIGLQFTSPSQNSDSRLLDQNRWVHPLGNSLNLFFDPISSGANASLVLDPSNFSSPFSISLPYGSYDVMGSTTASPFSAILPILIREDLQVSSTALDFIPKSSSSYGLLTISKGGLQEKPEVIIPENSSFYESGEFYYLYAETDLEAIVSIFPTGADKPFRSIWKSQSFQHKHQVLQANPDDDTQTFIPVDFALIQEIIPLDQENKPIGLSPTLVSLLPNSQSETSGLSQKEGRLFSINDSGDDAVLYELDPDEGQVLRRIRLENGANKDWESLAQSEEYLFVGDIGNNNGTRRDLLIYKIAWSDILSSDQVAAEEITFTYEDQNVFTGQLANHNFDSEALIFAEGQLHIFTKNRGDNKTKHYSLSAEKGNHIAELKEEFNVNGLITGADFDPALKNLVLIGYTDEGLNSKSFIWLISGFNSDQFFSGKTRRIELGSPVFLGQTEGVSFSDNSLIHISAEEISQGGFSVDQRLMKMELTGLY